MSTPGVEVGLCEGCRYVRVVRSDRGSVFYQCRRSQTDARYPAYPRLPVLRCAGYEPAGVAGPSAGSNNKS